MTGSPTSCSGSTNTTVCSQALAPGRPWRNRVCALPEAERQFSRVDAVAMYSGALRDKMHKLK